MFYEDFVSVTLVSTYTWANLIITNWIDNFIFKEEFVGYYCQYILIIAQSQISIG